MAEIVRLALRMGPVLHQALKRLAERDKRSLNAEILYILERYARDEGEQVGD